MIYKFSMIFYVTKNGAKLDFFQVLEIKTLKRKLCT